LQLNKRLTNSIALLIWLVCALCIAVVIILACRGRSISANPNAPLEITYAGVGDPAEVAIIRGILADFEKQYPKYHVRFIHIPGEAYWTKVKIMFAGHVPPDVMYMGGGYLHELAAAGLLLDINDRASTKDFPLALSDFLPQALASYTYNGHLYGIPRDVAPMAMYYNKDLFDAAGLAYPTDDWTREGFLHLAQQLTRPSRHQFGCQIRIWENEFLPALWQSGGDLLDASRTRPVVNSPEAVSACRFLQNLQYKYHVAPTPQQQGGIPLFNQGSVAMMLGGFWEAPNFRPLRFHWSVARLPKDKIRADMLSGTAYSIAKATHNIEGAWKLAVYMSSAPVQRRMAIDSLAVPARLHVLSDSDLANDPVLATFVRCLPESRPPPFVPRWLEVEAVMNRHFDRLMRNIETPEQMVAGLAEDLAPLVKPADKDAQ
jgi:multiple sugar transport system substrate-binding protein